MNKRTRDEKVRKARPEKDPIKARAERVGAQTS